MLRRRLLTAALDPAAIGVLAATASGLIGTASAATPIAADASLIDDLVSANHILYDQAVVDGFGHVSVRHDKDPSRFLLARSMAPGLVTAEDIMEFDADGNATDPQGRAVYLERFIHSEIYKARPDVKAVVHSHSPAVIPFGVTSVPLMPIYHMSSFLGTGVPIFEIRTASPEPTNMLVSNPALGAALARALDGANVALMRGHGDVVVGQSIPQVVFRAVYTEINARLEADALRLGNVNFLTPEEAAKATETNNTVLGRAWELWKRQSQAKR